MPIKSKLICTVVTILTGEFTGIKVLATVSVAVAMLVAAFGFLCLNRNRQSWNCKGDYKILNNEHILFLKKLESDNKQFYLYIIVLTMSRIPEAPVVSMSG